MWCSSKAQYTVLAISSGTKEVCLLLRLKVDRHFLNIDISTKNWPKIKKVSFKIYSSLRFRCTPYMLDSSKNWLRKLKSWRTTKFLLKITLQCPQYDFIWHSKGPGFISRETVSFYGNGKYFSLVPHDIAGTIYISITNNVIWKFESILLTLNPCRPR